SPSAYTDFEVHLSYLFVSKKFDIASEVKKITKPVLCYYGTSESDKPLSALTMKNFKLIMLKGDHHYDNSFSEIVNTGL
ncbi:MAG: AcvB/VirJ family lysyl-phosphatidylglycerol hydrolase, partial [Ginsengibacter sp.]